MKRTFGAVSLVGLMVVFSATALTQVVRTDLFEMLIAGALIVLLLLPLGATLVHAVCAPNGASSILWLVFFGLVVAGWCIVAGYMDKPWIYSSFCAANVLASLGFLRGWYRECTYVST